MSQGFRTEKGAPVIARVEPLTRTRALRGPFDYRLRPEHGDVRIGSLLRVPFSGRDTVAVVVALAERSELPPDRLAEPATVLPTRIPEDLVALASWMAREYCSTPSRALELVMAPGAKAGTKPRRTLVATLTPSHVNTEGDPVTDAQRALLDALANGPVVASELGTPALRRLEKRGLVTIEERLIARRPRRHAVGRADASPPQLTTEQSAAVDRVLASLRNRNPDSQSLLLHGVTGSGKTEVYLHAVADTLAAGRSAIVLVPEIALTPQALARFEARLGDVVAVMHSGITGAQRAAEWQRLARGEARVCIGPRSAVFAPLTEIGLVIVDEEHEASYKHEGDPRYDARTVAAQRARDHGAVLLLGSATPRPETVAGTTRLRLRERVDRRPLPPVHVLDMRGHHHPLHPETRNALSDLRRAGGKAIVLLNRRGWSNFLSCRACGRVWTCPQCDVALVLHRAGDRVACHHCGHSEPVPHRCPDCASVSVARHGAGTERVEHELRDALGDASFPILRLDADSAGLDARAGTLERFAAAGAGVLVGTQMVAKGHDFPDVGLGIVLDADSTLRFPDFRAEERTFALITQLAGRAGRGIAGGRVLVQTLAPDARSIRFAARHDADGFLSDELTHRQALSYPPFASLIRIVCASPEGAEAWSAAGVLHGLITPPGATVLGPAPLFRLRGRDRVQLVIKARDRAGAIHSVGAAVGQIGSKVARRGVSVSVDVDPQ
jgi:primosomal protein N' (replication factor Y) (superfamily II helicase)